MYTLLIHLDGHLWQAPSTPPDDTERPASPASRPEKHLGDGSLSLVY